MLNAGCHELTTKSFVRFFGKRQAIWPFSRWCAKRDHVPDHSWRRAWNVFSTLHWTSWSVISPLALVIRLQHRLRADLLCSDLLGRQTKTSLNQVFQPCDEACGWSPIDDIMIQTDRQTQVLPDGDVPIHDAWLLADATKSEEEAVGVFRTFDNSGMCLLRGLFLGSLENSFP